jgi:hypothetical protein
MVRRRSPHVLVGSSNLANLSIATMVVEGRGVVKRASLWTVLDVRWLASDGVTGLLSSILEAGGILKRPVAPFPPAADEECGILKFCPRLEYTRVWPAHVRGELAGCRRAYDAPPAESD